MPSNCHVVALTCLVLGLHAAGAPADEAINPSGFPRRIPEGGQGVVRIWIDGGTWHLRTSTEDSTGKKDKLTVFTGSVRTEDKMTVTGSQLEKGNGKKGDKITPHLDGKGFDFRFATHGAKDTADFTLGARAKTLKFVLKIDGQPVEASRICIGAEGKSPGKAEFTLPAQTR